MMYVSPRSVTTHFVVSPFRYSKCVEENNSGSSLCCCTIINDIFVFVVKRLFDIEKPTPPLGFFESWPPHCNLLRRCIIDGEGSMFLGMIQLSSGFPALLHSFCCSTTWPIVLLQHYAAKKNLLFFFAIIFMELHKGQKIKKKPF